MAKDLKVFVGVLDVQLPLTLQFIFRSIKGKPTNYEFHIFSHENHRKNWDGSVSPMTFGKKGPART